MFCGSYCYYVGVSLFGVFFECLLVYMDELIQQFLCVLIGLMCEEVESICSGVCLIIDVLVIVLFVLVLCVYLDC